MKFYSENEAIDKVIGGKDTQSRMEFEAQMNEFLIGEAMFAHRPTNQLTNKN